MGCVSSTLLSHAADDDFTQISCSTTFRHHIVSLTSSTYGLLTVDPPPSSPPSSSSASFNLSPTTAPTPPRFNFPTKPTEVINSWELMAGLDSTPTPTPPDHAFHLSYLPLKLNKENSNPNVTHLRPFSNVNNDVVSRISSAANCSSLDMFEKICPPNGVNKVVIYTTTLRAVRKTFEACNAVRSAFEGFRVSICERDISMHRGFKEELRELLKGKDSSELILPRVFVKGRYIGGVEEVTRIVEEDGLGDLLQGLPKLKKGTYVCDGCGGARFLPCFTCNGSCKIVMEEMDLEQERTEVVRCSECNENGLVLCPICS